MLYAEVICFQAGLLAVTWLPIGCEQSQLSAAAMELETQLGSVPAQATLSFAAINCAARR